MRFSIFATALAAAVLCTSAAWGQVRSFVYSVSNGGVSKATVDITSRDGSRVDVAALSISQRGGSADATVNADAKRDAHVVAGAEAVTAGGLARAVKRTVGRGDSKVDTEAVARAWRGGDAEAIATGVVQRTLQPGQVIHRVEAMATDGGHSVSRGDALDLD